MRLSRDNILDILRAEGVWARRYFHPGVHRLEPYADAVENASTRLPVTEALCETVLQMPLGAQVSVPDVHSISDLLLTILSNAEELAERLDGGSQTATTV